MNLELLVLAAGMGSRYGGLKQIDPVGENGEAIIDYSVYDALRAKFSRLVFVIRRDIEKEFRDAIGKKFEDKIDVAYVYQELDDIPEAFSVPADRAKPWGTGHAIFAARKDISSNFAVINGDDFYGADSFQVLGEYLGGIKSSSTDFSMVAYTLRNTLSPYGSVSRGVCSTDSNGFLESVTEFTKIEKSGEGALSLDGDGMSRDLTGEEIVSMNMFGFTPEIFSHLESQFASFLKISSSENKAEFYIPTVVNDLIKSKNATVKVLHSQSSWFGITYREDKPYVIESIRKLIENGTYPQKLW